MKDCSWALLLDPPDCFEGDGQGADSRGYLCREDVSGIDIYAILDAPGSSVEQKSSFLSSMLMNFLYFSIDSDSGLAAWTRTHLAGIMHPLVSSLHKRAAVSLSPLCALFPLTQLADFRSVFALPPNPQAAKLRYQAALREYVALHMSDFSPGSWNPEFLCNQLLMRATLFLLQVVISQKRKPQMGEALSLISVTLARLLNDCGHWSAVRVVRGAESLLTAQETAGQDLFSEHLVWYCQLANGCC